MERINRMKKDNLVLEYLLVFLASFLIYASFIFYYNYYFDSISYFHSEYTKLLSEGKHEPFIWLPYTIFKDRFIDHHFLWHYLLCAFYCLFGDYGFKIGISFFNALFCVIWHIACRDFSETRNNHFLFLLLLFGGPVAFNRYIMMRVVSFSLVLLLLGIYLFANRKYYAAFFISFFILSYFLVPFFCQR